ncbi:hypothetical protein [Hyalangium gracile]|uniref:hypothetical protein n=1 Tax=Hyalangium gracile TaxID=394092 RepID=UPI001CCD6677|nr:hypothetical protein [Hyalangium gracile]
MSKPILIKVMLGIVVGVVAILMVRKSSSAAPAGLPRLDGSVQILASLLQTEPPTEVAGIKVTLSGPELAARTETLTRMGTQWQGVIQGLPVGKGNTLSAEAVDAEGNVIFTAGATDLGFSNTQRTLAALAMQKSSIQPTAVARSPRLAAILSSADAVKPGGTLSLQASVTSGTPGSPLTFEWTASAGSLTASTSASTTWVAPAQPGPVTFSFTATGAEGLTTSASFTLAVEHSHGLPAMVSFNHAPQVVSAAPVPPTLMLGQPLPVSAIVADEDPSTLVYKWSAQCKGSWREPEKSSAMFIPGPQGPMAACTRCDVTLVATASSGESTTRKFPMCVGPEVASEGLPQISQSSQSSGTVAPGGKVTFTVSAQDPMGGLLAYSWTANVGTIEEIEKNNSTSQALWTAPRCLPRGTELSIQASVANALGAATTPFTVTGLPLCRNPSPTDRTSTARW